MRKVFVQLNKVMYRSSSTEIQVLDCGARMLMNSQFETWQDDGMCIPFSFLLMDHHLIPPRVWRIFRRTLVQENICSSADLMELYLLVSWQKESPAPQRTPVSGWRFFAPGHFLIGIPRWPENQNCKLYTKQKWRRRHKKTNILGMSHYFPRLLCGGNI